MDQEQVPLRPRSGITLTFSGAVSGIESNQVNCASRPPLERVVRRGLFMDLIRHCLLCSCRLL